MGTNKPPLTSIDLEKSSSSLPDAQSTPSASTRILWLKQAVAGQDRSLRWPKKVGSDAGGVP